MPFIICVRSFHWKNEISGWTIPTETSLWEVHASVVWVDSSVVWNIVESRQECEADEVHGRGLRPALPHQVPGAGLDQWERDEVHESCFSSPETLSRETQRGLWDSWGLLCSWDWGSLLRYRQEIETAEPETVLLIRFRQWRQNQSPANMFSAVQIFKLRWRLIPPQPVWWSKSSNN